MKTPKKKLPRATELEARANEGCGEIQSYFCSRKSFPPCGKGSLSSERYIPPAEVQPCPISIVSTTAAILKGQRLPWCLPPALPRGPCQLLCTLPLEKEGLCSAPAQSPRQRRIWYPWNPRHAQRRSSPAHGAAFGAAPGPSHWAAPGSWHPLLCRRPASIPGSLQTGLGGWGGREKEKEKRLRQPGS